MLQRKENFLRELKKLHERKVLSDTVGPDYYEPGMMEFLDQSEGIYDQATGEILLRFESRGTRYEGRTEQIELVEKNSALQIVRDPENPYNPNNFRILTERGKDVGNMPAELCNVIAPLWDVGALRIEKASVSYVEPISRRSRHARQAILFAELRGKLLEP